MIDEKNCGLMASARIPVAESEEIDATYCLNLLRRIRDVVFASVDAAGLPSARVIDVMHVDDRRLYFLVPRGKAFHDEIVRDPMVAVVGQTTDFRTCRLRGRAVRAEDEEQRRLVDWMFELNPSMNELYPGEARYACEVFYIEDGSGDYFDLGQKPVVRVPFDIGDGAPRMGGIFEVADACTGCGRCLEACPQGCIVRTDAGKCRIDQGRCLRCGLCCEACPHGAIERA